LILALLLAASGFAPDRDKDQAITVQRQPIRVLERCSDEQKWAGGRQRMSVFPEDSVRS
jgi:hypothetical protein